MQILHNLDRIPWVESQLHSLCTTRSKGWDLDDISVHDLSVDDLSDLRICLCSLHCRWAGGRRRAEGSGVSLAAKVSFPREWRPGSTYFPLA